MSEEVRQMFQQFTSQYGRLKAVTPSGANRVTLEFENGEVSRPPLLTYGYRGAGQAVAEQLRLSRSTVECATSA